MKLINLFSWVSDLVETFTFYGGGGKGGGGDSGGTSTVSQVTIPPELIPYIVESMKEAQKVAALPYVGYGGKRIASLTPQQKAAMSGIGGLKQPGEFKQAGQMLSGVGQLGMGSAAQGLGRAFSYNPQEFGAQQADQYMSPYQQRVTDATIRQAQLQNDITKRSADLNAVNQGTYGGARQALLQANRESNLTQNIGDIQAKGSQAAFENAQAQFERDQGRAANAAQLFGQLGTAGLGAAQQAGSSIADLGTASQNAALQRLAAQMGAGDKLQQQNQSVLGQKYQDFLEQRGYPRDQASWYAQIVRGLPVQNAGTTTTTQPAPSMWNSLGGLGLAGLGLYNAMGKG